MLDDGFGYALFDDEGSPTARTSLISGGSLETFIHNSATAAHFGLQTTGNGARSPRSTLEVQLHQLEIGAGDADDDTVTAGEYLELTDLTGTHSGANAVAGDFSFGASGFLCRDGERVKPVRNITVAGNFYEMLNSNKIQNNNSPTQYNGGSEMMLGKEFSPPHFAGAVKHKHAE